MLGHKVVQRLAPHFEIAGTLRSDQAPEVLASYQLYTGTDASDAETFRPGFEDFQPAVVINCIGIVKQMEKHVTTSDEIIVNALFPHQIQKLCDEVDAKLIHISSDCVFSGLKGEPYAENDPSDAHDNYGKTKLLGEVSNAPHLTLRTSMIGPELRQKLSLFEWFASNRGGAVKGFKNALFSGFPTVEIANILQRIMTDYPDLTGLYHLAAPHINKYDLLTKINEVWGLGITIESDEAVMCDRRLDGSRLHQAIDYTPPSWDDLLAEMHRDMLSSTTELRNPATNPDRSTAANV